MVDILLLALNAKYAHAAFGLRYLKANLGPLADRCEILEFEAAARSVDVIEAVLRRAPRIVGLGVYIWNTDAATRLVSELKRIAPEITVVIGGPEVSYETVGQPIADIADHTIQGEADLAFRTLCEQLLAGERPREKIIAATLPRFSQLRLPYDLYTDGDIARRVVYVEASRGCPYECEFCLSSLDIPVRQAPLDLFLAAMQRLLDRGLRQFKFVDRTFNLNLRVSREILAFFLERYRPGLFLHFEMVPDRLPESLCDLIARFPPGAMQFEVGIQTFNPRVSELISRRQDVDTLEANLRWLREQTGVHVHADLIVGLPGEDLPSFGAGFDRLVSLQPQEIQVGLLKRLKGTPIQRHDAEWGMVYSPAAPFEILRTRLIDFVEMQRLRRFARYWDLVANSGNFTLTLPLIWGDDSPFESMLRFSDWLYTASGRTNGIALKRLVELVFEFLVTQRGLPPRTVAETVYADYLRGGRSDRPPFLRPYITDEAVPPRAALSRQTGGTDRQIRHASGRLES
jgi:radical SAM superfamily enzyme YgiQ (UPF0313 family)